MIELGPIRRARDYYLYDQGGRRWLDLWLDDGRALYGHRPPGLARVLKSFIDRGLYAPCQNYEQPRLTKLLSQLVPGFSQVALWPASPSLPIAEPFAAAAPLTRWRPGWNDYQNSNLLAPLLPLPGFAAPLFLLARQQDDIAALRETFSDHLSPSWQQDHCGRQHTISPLLAAAFKKIISLLINQPLPWSAELIDWFARLPWWQSYGPYLRYCGELCYYREISAVLAEQQILLPPAPTMLAIVPPVINSGDAKSLYRAVTKLGVSCSFPPEKS